MKFREMMPLLNIWKFVLQTISTSNGVKKEQFPLIQSQKIEILTRRSTYSCETSPAKFLSQAKSSLHKENES